MRLFIKTPWFQDNKYIPHLLEHCVLQTSNISDFINIQVPIYASTATGYTEFEFNEDLLGILLERIKTPILKQNFDLHQKIINQELKELSFGQKSYINLLKKISGNKKLVSNHIQKGITFDDVINYQKKYYRLENMILVDDNNELVQLGGIENSIKSNPEIFPITNIETATHKYKGEESSIIFCKYKTAYEILFLDFLCDFINDYKYYLDTNKGKYWHDYSDISLTDKYMILCFDKGYIPTKLNKDFFEQYKQYVIKNILNGKNRNYIPIITLFTREYISMQQHAKFIENLDFNDLNFLYK